MNESREWITPYIEPDIHMGCQQEYEYERRPGFPLVLHLNLHNGYDPVRGRLPEAAVSNPAVMDWELYRKVIDEFSDCGGEIIALCPHSEPFMVKEAVDYIRYAALKGLKFYFTTDMRGLNDEILTSMINFALDARFQVLFPGIFEETYRKTTGNCLWDSLENTKNLKRKYGNISYIRALKENFLPFEVEVVQFYWNYHGLGVVFEEPGDSIRYDSDGLKGLRRLGVGCIHLLNSLTVDADGSVLLCPSDVNAEHVLGNLRETSIKEIWEGEELASITKEVYKEECKGLDILCNRCPKVCL